MDQLSQSFAALDASLAMWIAGGVAALFVVILVIDAVRQRRKRPPYRGRRN
jgi:hypothetical protein